MGCSSAWSATRTRGRGRARRAARSRARPRHRHPGRARSPAAAQRPRRARLVPARRRPAAPVAAAVVRGPRHRRRAGVAARSPGRRGAARGRALGGGRAARGRARDRARPRSVGARSDAHRAEVEVVDRGRRAIVFVGPSLAGDPPPPDGDVVELRPPARRGDLRAAAAEGVRVIGLVDGELYQELAVTPAEVREAAGAGVRLFGAASLGALRAVECAGAMTGVGRVYEAFASGRLAADDEVAGTYDPVTHHAVAWPLVIVREALALAVRDGVLDDEAARAVLSRVRARPFFERTERAVADAAGDPARAAALVERLRSDEGN